MTILLIGEERALSHLNDLLKNKGTLISAATSHKAVECLGAVKPKITAIVWAYLPQSEQSVQALLQEAPLIPLALLTESGAFPDMLAFKSHSGPVQAFKMGASNEVLSFLDSGQIPDSDFMRFDIRSPTFRTQVNADAYIRLGPGRYYKRFHKEDGFSPEDIQTLINRKGLDYLYIHKADSEKIIGKNVAKVDAILANIRATEEEMREAASETMEVVHEVSL
ncbi:MAG: hypothetical protein ACXWQO_03840, partial [Bdellovibrionota bacterium]